MPRVSLLIPSKRRRVHTIKNNPVLRYVDEIKINREPGLSYARNRLAEESIGDTLIYADDDVTVTADAWETAQMVPLNTIVMTEGRNHPIARFMALRRDTFNLVGGFDEKIRYNGEDLDYYLRARAKDVTVKTLTGSHIIHIEHPRHLPPRAHMESAYIRVKHGFMSPGFFIQRNPLVSLYRFTGYCRCKLNGGVL